MTETALTDDVSCREIVELVTDYLEGALPPSEHARFEAQLAECEGCARYVDQMRATVRLSRDAAALAPRPHMSALLTAFRG